MNTFDFNYTHVDHRYGMIVSQSMAKIIRERARQIMTDFFRLISIQWEEKEDVSIPRLSSSARKAIKDIFNEGRIEEPTASRIQSVAIRFIQTLNQTERECLSFYFSTSQECLEEIDELIAEESSNDDGDEEEGDISYTKEGEYISRRILRMMTDSEDMSYYMVKELIHLQDIFSTEDLELWDVTSITFANENFEKYAGEGQVLIPASFDECEYWKSLLGRTESTELADSDEDE